MRTERRCHWLHATAAPHRRNPEERGLELLALRDVHRHDAVLNPGFLEEEERLVAVRRGREVKLDHVVSLISLAVRAESSCTTTPSIGSTAASHGERSIMRRVSSMPACQRARMPARLKSMSFR